VVSDEQGEGLLQIAEDIACQRHVLAIGGEMRDRLSLAAKTQEHGGDEVVDLPDPFPRAAEVVPLAQELALKSIPFGGIGLLLQALDETGKTLGVGEAIHWIDKSRLLPFAALIFRKVREGSKWKMTGIERLREMLP
jgi:hypothetical protein